MQRVKGIYRESGKRNQETCKFSGSILQFSLYIFITGKNVANFTLARAPRQMWEKTESRI